MPKLGSSKNNETELNVGLIVPFMTFRKRDYIKSITKAIASINKVPSKHSREDSYTFLKKFDFKFKNVHMEMMKVNPSPTGNIT